MCTKLKRPGKSEIGLLYNAVVDGVKDGVYVTILRFLCFCNDNFRQ
jgi:hypothetical protein